MTESEYLAARSRDAKAGIRRTLTLSGERAQDAANPKNFAWHMPLAAVGTAVVAGAAAAFVMVPSKRRAQEKAAAAANGYAPKAGRRTSLGKQALRMGLRYAKPMIISSITGALSGVIGGKKGGEAAAEDAVDDAVRDAGTAGHADSYTDTDAAGPL